MPVPIVAIVGRPNVGKSTLFNKIIGERLAIIQDEPGTTRDRVYGQSEWNGVTFTLIDTGGIQVTSAAEDAADAMAQQIRFQAEAAVAEADVIVLLADAKDGLTSSDEIVADLLRPSGKPIILGVNKAESEERRLASADFYRLGLGEPIPMSAYHGSGVGDLLDAITANLPAAIADEGPERVCIAIVGRPNVGKSALLNALLGQQRVIVSEVPGTTRDAIDTRVEWDDTPVTLVDTAGIRRRGKVEHGVEQYSVIRSLKAINRADVVLLVIDAAEGITNQDLHVAGYVLDALKGLVVVMNKWDLVEKDSTTMDRYAEHVRQSMEWSAEAPITFVSALTGQRVGNIRAVALKVAAERSRRVPTGELNRLIRAAFTEHPAPTAGGRRQKFFYATQPATRPPTFVFYITDPKELHFSYKRYLENVLRKEYGLAGVPVRLSFRARGGLD